MTSGWFPPKEDSPSVVSNRVFMIRRLNKMESQRLGVRLDGLNAEVQQARSLISQEQQELRKQLTQIREVKENPSVSVERRKLLQQFSCKEARRPDHGFSDENQRTQQRYRSWSNDDRFRGAPLTQLPLVNGRSRSKSSCTPPRKEQLSISDFRKLRSGGSNDTGINISPSEAWPDISTFVTTKTKPRQRSVSTGAYPRISAWEGIDKNDGVACLTRDDIFTSTRFESKKSRSNQDLLSLELRHSPNWAREGTRRYTTKKHSATELSEVETGHWHGRENVAICQSNELASTRTELRQRSFSTNSAPIISEGRVLEVCTEGANKTSTVSADQSVGSASSRQRRYSTNCRPRNREGVVVDVPDHKNTNRNRHCQGAPVQFTRRERSSSTNCPPLVLEGGTIGESDDDKERKQRSWSSESEDGSIEDGDATIDVVSHGKSCHHISTFGTGDKAGQNQGNDISLPRL